MRKKSVGRNSADVCGSSVNYRHIFLQPSLLLHPVITLMDALPLHASFTSLTIAHMAAVCGASSAPSLCTSCMRLLF